MAARLRDVNPDLKVHATLDFVSAHNVEELLNGSYTFVVDAVDRVEHKARSRSHLSTPLTSRPVRRHQALPRARDAGDDDGRRRGAIAFHIPQHS